MSFKDRLSVSKINDEETRKRALEVFEVVYRNEKSWVPNLDQILPLEDLNSDKVSWFAAYVDGKMVGVTRVLYELPLELYEEYGFKIIVPGLDVEKFIAENNIAEVGRFAVLPEYRSKILVAAGLMRACSHEALLRDFTHFITDVFEADPNTPYGFHKRVLGFIEVATHDHGELKVESRRITMLLDLKDAAKRFVEKKGWIYRYLMEGLPAEYQAKPTDSSSSVAAVH